MPGSPLPALARCREGERNQDARAKARWREEARDGCERGLNVSERESVCESKSERVCENARLKARARFSERTRQRQRKNNVEFKRKERTREIGRERERERESEREREGGGGRVTKGG
jgi:zinc finger CCCH domain-containing protein 13